MYLKSLEMIGFKSFAERTKIDFEPGMMAIVGPNGCGKSNVADAIRWVLGEQRPTALRGGAMTDVIFNGTDQVKPMNMAEVSLTLADCEGVLGTEYHEVTVTRRVFRTGEGQYFINRTPCRLKDIQRLFMDTGIATDSYSLMEQGNIDQILSSRPDDRREVFEEASGISKYKADKQEALRKLEHTEANLLRLGDILKEVKRQIISLQRQVGKAKRYKALQEQLQACDLWLGRGRLSELDATLSALEIEYRDSAAREEQLRRQVEEMEAAAHGLRQSLAQTEENISAAMDAAAEAAAALARTRELIAANRERAKELESISQRDSRETETARTALRQQQAEWETLQKEQAAAIRALDAARRDLETKQSALAEQDRQIAAARQKLQNLRTEALELEGRLARLQNEWNELEARERSDLIRRERTAAEKAEADRAVESFEERLALMAAEQTQKQTAVDAARQQVETLRKTQADRAAEQLQIQQEAARLSAELAAREAQIALLTRNRAEARGFSAGARKLLESTASEPGTPGAALYGALAAQIRAAKPWQRALEAVLRAWLDAVVVRDAAAARELAGRLQAEQSGSARLLPLAPASGESLPAAEGPGEPLLPHVQAPPELAPLLRHLLGPIRAFPSLAEIPPSIPPGITCVTRDGLVLRADGSAEVWDPGEQPDNPLAREHQLAAWHEDQDRLRRRQADLQDRTARLEAAAAAARAELEAATARAEELRHELDLASGEIRMVEREARQARERAETIGWELKSLLDKTDASARRRAEMAAEMETLRTRQAEIRAALATGADQLRQWEDRRAARLEEATEARVTLSACQQQMEGLKARGAPLEARLRELEALIRDRSAGIDSYRERIAALEQAAAAAAEQIGPLEAEVARCQSHLQEARRRREQRTAELEQSEAEIHARRAELDAAREERNKAELQLARLRLQRQNLVERLSADYRLQPADILRAPEPDWDENGPPADREALETLVAELRAKLQSMGPVNLVAIEEYHELEERYAFLNQQNDDLLNAKQQLLDLIRKINETTTEMFLTAFRQVNENFQELFRQLFGGGSGKLVLVDEENVLESGIEIIARPPGKKLQTVSLLSGGERTLTAVALLFALFKVKPSPFCLTDELDAALDDSNIARYLEMLKGFLKDTQFIVITHNRQTIAAADALYGVTMEKQGISKIVSVRFRREDEPATPPPPAPHPA